jgi:hypothetical protein
LLQNADRSSLSSSSRRRIRDLARDRLHGVQGVGVILRAMELAVTTNDVELVSRVRQLAVDRDALRNLGIASDLVFYVQERAKAVLAGGI